MFKRFLIVGLLMMTSVACAQPGVMAEEMPTVVPPTATAETTPVEPTPVVEVTPTEVPDKAIIEAIEVQIAESLPLQATAILRGTFPDACTIVDSITQTRLDNTITLVINIARLPNARCAPQATPFEQNVELDITDLPDGEYTVVSDEVTAGFAIGTENATPPAP